MTRALRMLAPVWGLALLVANTAAIAASASPYLGPAVDRGIVADRDHVLELGVAARAAATTQPPSIPDIIRTAFAPLGPDAVTWGLRIGFCESTYNPDAVNPSSGTEGLFQFQPSTWAETPEAASSPFDPAANAQAAAWLFTNVGPNQWECQ
jgi:hypothetical protein